MASPSTLQAGPGTRGSNLPAPPRDRRPLLAGLAVLLILVGALASGLIAYRSGSRSDVLVAAHEIKPGETITAEDFTTTRVASDGAEVIDAASLDNFLNTQALVTIPEGTLVNRSMFVTGSAVPADAVVVGLVLTAQQQPAQPIKVGDVVRLFRSAQSGESTGGSTGSAGEVLANAVKVMEVGRSAEGSSSTRVSVLVSAEAASQLIPASTAGQVAVAKLAANTKPAVDLQGN
ncbi:SAF domain-containing protein [Saxibacter everestensis]|uniref:SAF domain-containing protein n=1 Tax=Saxibacter everestensis TaxID=2909229 RepID=A0ABY8QWT2_9MICO|nr:SAF domain-containing protein [Brevibacteriaceae bacterium ZFBP1038]